MKITNIAKKTLALLATVCLASALSSGSVSAHGSNHHSQSSHSGTYCSYHHKNHNSKSSCNKYCPVHKTTHSNGKIHKKKTAK